MAAEKVTTPKVYEAITEVMNGLCELGGIAKKQRNSDQGYNFRGIDDVYNALARLLVAHKLVILPRVLSREETHRPTRNNSVQFNVVLHVELDMISSLDGSKHTIATYGEASDMADKATNKAMSAAYKYAIIQAFCIPIDIPDADASTPEDTVGPNYRAPAPPASNSKPSAASKPAASRPAAAKPPAAKSTAAPEAPAAGAMLSTEEVAEMQAAIDGAQTDEQIRSLGVRFIKVAAPKGKPPMLSLGVASELARSITAKRASTVTADTWSNYADMVAAFVQNKFLGQTEANEYLNSAKENI